MFRQVRAAVAAFREGGVAKPEKEIRYGDDKTIHHTGDVNVEIGPEGDVVSVWFRCMMLPFTESRVGHRRASDMRQLPVCTMPSIKAIVFEGVEQGRGDAD